MTRCAASAGPPSETAYALNAATMRSWLENRRITAASTSPSVAMTNATFWIRKYRRVPRQNTRPKKAMSAVPARKIPQSVENRSPSRIRPSLSSEAPSIRNRSVSPYCPKKAAGIPT
ncbi:hypothetical protein HRbin12_00668 [bacterium HR12]|nr:hypothetical protein HRbin12_00668 [bacterium HR12]